MIKTVSILGAKYKVYTGVPVEKDEELRERFGYCSFLERKIVVADLNSIEDWKSETDKSKEKHNRITLRHEIIHAFLAESGLWGNSLSPSAWALNEEMIDWLAMQMPKILRAFEQMGCLEVE